MEENQLRRPRPGEADTAEDFPPAEQIAKFWVLLKNEFLNCRFKFCEYKQSEMEIWDNYRNYFIFQNLH